MGECKYCKGTGVQYVERGSSLCYQCTDCDGTGFIPECPTCGEEYYSGYCPTCQTLCDQCGEIGDRYSEHSDICVSCYEDAIDRVDAVEYALCSSESWEKVDELPGVEMLELATGMFAFRKKFGLDDYSYVFLYTSRAMAVGLYKDKMENKK